MDKKVTAGVIATVLLAVFTIIASLLFCDSKGCEQDDRKTILEVSNKFDNLNRSFDDLNTSFSGACRGVCLKTRQKELNLATAFQNLTEVLRNV